MIVKPKPKQVVEKDSSSTENTASLSDLQVNPDLWYKILVLLHDLCNIKNVRAAEARTLATTDELYISAPYFTVEEASAIKSTMVMPPVLTEPPEFEALEIEEEDDGKENVPSETTVHAVTKLLRQTQSKWRCPAVWSSRYGADIQSCLRYNKRAAQR